MAAATLTKPTKPKPTTKSVRVRLVEDMATGIGKVDAANGIIHNAKIVGFQSRNIGRTIGLDAKTFGNAVDLPYSYSRRALEDAVPMYEGATIRIDHPLSELDESGKRIIRQRSRPAMSTSGVLRNVHVGEDGLYGDIHLFLHHPHTAFILEVAERAPSKLACSHNADGSPVLKDGRAVIDHINHVFSVDIVGDRPGTTNGLFEDFVETKVVKRTIQQVIDGLPKDSIGRAELLEMASEMYSGKRVSEMDAGPMMPPIGAADAGGGAHAGTGAPANPQAQVGDALRTVVMAIYDDPTLDAGAKLGKIKEIFKLKSKLDGSNVDPTAGDGGGVDDPEDLTDDGADESTEGGDSKKPFGDKKKTPESDSGTTDDETNMEESMAALAQDPKLKPLLETVETLRKTTNTLKAENDELKNTSAARTLLESLEREPTDIRIAAVKSMKDDAAKKALIESWPKKEEQTGAFGQRPERSAPLIESVPEQAENSEGFARRIRSR